MCDYDKEVDFLKEKQGYNYIITNPPFSIAGDFIEKAKELSERFSFLLPLSYLHGKKRYDEVYCDSSFPLESIYVFTRYPMLGDPLLESGQHRTGMMVYAWFTFSKLVTNKEPVIRWLDNQNFVVGEKEWKDLLMKQQQKKMWKKDALKSGWFQKIFFIETEETEFGFPDVLAIQCEEDGTNAVMFFEFKVTDKKDRIKFQRTQPAWYIRNKGTTNNSSRLAQQEKRLSCTFPTMLVVDSLMINWRFNYEILYYITREFSERRYSRRRKKILEKVPKPFHNS